ncbi:MAG: ABC transporter permease [Chitinophagales bacterium]|nr:ABC transporter permease [Chitinophagales bacterium]
MKKFARLLKKEFKRIFTNRVVMLVFFGAPLLYGLLFVHMYEKGKITEMPVLIVDEDHSPLSAKFIDALDDNENLLVADIRFQKANLSSEMPSKEYVSVISIPDGFESAVLQKRYPELQVDMNLTNLVTANFATRAIQTVMSTLSAGMEMETLKKTGIAPAYAAQLYEPFKVSYNRLYNPAGNYKELMMPGILGTVMQQVLFLALALVFARDFEDDYFRKLVEASRWAVYHLLLKITPFVLLSALLWLVIGMFFPLFKIGMPVFTIPMLALVVLFNLACMCMGMLFSLILPSQLKATEFLMVLATPSFLLSGYTWPTEAMPVVVQRFADLIPLTHFLHGFRKAAVYGGMLQDIAYQLWALGLIALVCLLLALVMLQWKINRVRRKKKPLHTIALSESC